VAEKVEGHRLRPNRRVAVAAVDYQAFADERPLNRPLESSRSPSLARAYALRGDLPKAHGAYQRFLTLWKDADPDIPVFQQAKSDYARLP
jgi:hypothetical protein